MKKLRIFLLCLIAVATMTSCHGGSNDALPAAVADDLNQMDRQDLTLHADGYPDATITTEGDLLIDGTQVDITSAQRALLMQYRGQIKNIAQQGVHLGMQGTTVGTTAAKAALEGVFSGNTSQIGPRVKAETDKIKAEVQAMCGYVAELRQAQAALATQLPAFAPYAHADQNDFDNCNID